MDRPEKKEIKPRVKDHAKNEQDRFKAWDRHSDCFGFVCEWTEMRVAYWFWLHLQNRQLHSAITQAFIAHAICVNP